MKYLRKALCWMFLLIALPFIAIEFVLVWLISLLED